MVRMPAGCVLTCLALLLSVASAAAAQTKTTGQLTGTVTDASGAVIRGADIIARNSSTGLALRAVSDATGVWLMHSVPSGTYTLRVTLQGFNDVELKDIRVDADSLVKKDVMLQVGFAEEIVVTTSRYEEGVLNAPATASVISEQAILDAPTRHMADLLRTVPGMNVAQMSGRQLGVTSRSATGVMPTTQLVLVDGRTAYCDYLGGTYWDNVPTNIDEIKQVEVVRGPASSVWGPYAMNGVVNIVTKPPRQMLGTTLTFGAGTFDRSGGAAESNRGALYYISGTHARALNDRWAFKITGGASTQDAFARPQGLIPNEFHTPYPQFPNVRATQPKVDGRIDYDFPDGKQRLEFEGGFTTGTGITYSGFGPGKADWPDRAGYGRVNYGRGALGITGYVNTFDVKDTFLLFVDPAGQAIQWRVKAQIYHVDFSNSHSIRSKHLISYGASFRHMNVNAVLMPGVRRHNEGGAYFQDEMLLSNRFRWVVGARVDKSDVLSGVVFSPRTTFMIKPAPGQTIRVSYNRAYVAPWTLLNYFQATIMNSIDLGLIDPQLAGNYFYFPVSAVGNKDLHEQSQNAYEAGYAASIANDRIRLGAAFYVNDSRGDFHWNQIGSYTSQDPPPGWPLPPFVLDAMIAANALGPGKGLPSLITTQNLGKVRNKGLELNADARINRYLTGYANYSWQARPLADEYDLSILNLPPRNRFNAGMSLDYERYLANVSVCHVGSAYWNDVINAIYGGSTKAYTVVNVTGGISWGVGKYTAMLKVANLANTPVQNHVWGDILKRQITGEFRVRF